MHHGDTVLDSEPRTDVLSKGKIVSSPLSNWLIYSILRKVIYVIYSISLCMKLIIKLEMYYGLYFCVMKVAEDALYYTAGLLTNNL